MRIPITATWYTGSGTQNIKTSVNKVPDFCPICLRHCDPRHLSGWVDMGKLQKVFGCTRGECQNLFIAYYQFEGDERQQVQERTYLYERVAPVSIEKKEFPEIINKISPQFSEIYNEAKEADDRGLKNICGAGYRKAIEFLIKDYLIKVKNKPEEDIKKRFLGNCIKELIDDENIKKCAERAVWIGNDETHYIRKWESKDLDDLKDLIDVTLNWIVNEYKTLRYIIEMPDKVEAISDEINNISFELDCDCGEKVKIKCDTLVVGERK